MPCEYEYDKDENKIIVDCSGCIYGSSVADYEQCMAKTIDKILEVKGVQSVMFKNDREYEYPYEQTQLLVEIADVLRNVMQDQGLRKLESFDMPKCSQYFEEKYGELQDLAMNQLRKDPVGAYLNLNRKIRHLKIKIKDSSEARRKCYEKYLKEVLIPIKELLGDTQLIKEVEDELSGYHPGDRKIYRDVFHPSVRPNFMRTKYMSQPPEQGEVVDHYLVGDTEVEIYEIPGQTRPVYHITPPEFKLNEDEYTILDAARRYITEHQPESAEFAESEKSRDVFSSIGKDLVRDLAERRGMKLDSHKEDRLTAILTRYTAGLGILEVLLADKNLQDIYINSPIGRRPIFIYHGKYGECKTNIIPTQDDAEAWATHFRLISGRPLDEANPVLDTSVDVPGGSARITVITRTLSPEGLGFAIRRHREDPWTYPLYLQPDVKYFNPLFAGFMSFLIDGGRTFLIGGGRSSGKTSLLGSSMLEMQQDWRIITTEDTLELPVDRMRKLGFDIESLKSRSVITQVETELPAPEAIRTALRLGDSALIIGEVRSSLRGDQEVAVVEDGVTKRIPIKEVEGRKDLQVPTMNEEKKFELQELTDFVKHPKREELVKVLTKTGREVTVTDDHSVFTVNDQFEIQEIETGELEEGDPLVIPASMPSGYNDLDYLNLVELLDGVQVAGYDEVLREVIDRIGYKRAGEIANVPEDNDIYLYLRKGQQRSRLGTETFRALTEEATVEYDPSKLAIKKGTSKGLPAKFPVNDDFCRFLGYYIAEGYISKDKRAVILTNSNPEIITDIEEIAEILFGERPYKRRKTEGKGESVELKVENPPLARLLLELGCGRTSGEKRVPPLLHGLSDEKIAAFLRGAYSGDGSFTSSQGSGNSIRYYTTSKNLADDLLYLLLTQGIVGRIYEKEREGADRKNLFSVEFKQREFVKRFLKEVGFVKYETEPVEKSFPHTKENSVPIDPGYLDEIADLPRKYRHLRKEKKCGKNYLKQVAEDTGSEELRQFADGEFYLDKVERIERVKLDEPEHVYDLSVSPTENFVGGFGGILLHNTEAQALYEAMRIGAMAKTVAGTIHGESAYGLYDRVVNDLGVPPTSFKATDIVIICNRLKSASGLGEVRRVTSVTEIRKHWSDDPRAEDGFVPLMEYSAEEDQLKPTDTFLNGESKILNRIASQVREWAGRWDRVWENIQLRAKQKKAITDYALKTDKKWLMEAPFVVKANNKLRLVMDEVKKEIGHVDAEETYDRWEDWLKKKIKES